MDGDREQFLIIDGHSMIYRAIFKRGAPLTAPSGEPTRGTYFFCRMLFSLIQEFKPAYLAMAVDGPRKKTWRRRIFPQYKANRGEDGPPEEVQIQFSRIVEIMRALGIPILEVEGHEADDVIATLVDACASPEVECVVCTRDKDLHQVIGPNCRMFDPQNDEWIDEAAVERRWGCPPSGVVEVQTLMGDTTDNVPGVYGVGAVKAKALVEEYGDVATIVKHEKELTPTVRKNLRAADLDLCRKLVELRTDLPIEITAVELEFNGFDMAAASPIFRRLGFASMFVGQ